MHVSGRMGAQLPTFLRIILITHHSFLDSLSGSPDASDSCGLRFVSVPPDPQLMENNQESGITETLILSTPSEGPRHDIV